MRKRKVVRSKSRNRKQLAEMAGGLASAADLAAFLGKKGLRPSKVVHALLAKNGMAVMRDVRMMAALRKYLLLEITESQMEEVCRGPDKPCVGGTQKQRAAAHSETQPIVDEATLAAAMKQMAEEGEMEE